MSDSALALVAAYGPLALFAALLISSTGVPLPGTFLLLAAGSLTSTGDMDLWQVLICGTIGAILGDQIGYFAGRLGSDRLRAEIVRWTNGGDRVDQAEVFIQRWGAAAIFFTRWLVGPLGPWVNLGSGSLAYPWRRFLWWDVLGEAIWVGLYVTLGVLFGDRIQVLAELVSSGSWALAGAVLAAVAGLLVVRHLRQAEHEAPAA